MGHYAIVLREATPNIAVKMYLPLVIVLLFVFNCKITTFSENNQSLQMSIFSIYSPQREILVQENTYLWGWK